MITAKAYMPPADAVSAYPEAFGHASGMADFTCVPAKTSDREQWRGIKGLKPFSGAINSLASIISLHRRMAAWNATA